MTTDLMAGTIPLGIDVIPAHVPMMKSGQLRGLTVTSRTRLPLAPDVPTVVELGCGDLVADNYFGVSDPVGLAKDVSDKLAQALAEIAAQPATVERFEELGITTLKMSPAATSGFVPKQTKDWAPTIDAADAMLPGVPLRIGRYELVFHVAAYFRAAGAPLDEEPFLVTVPVAFGIAEPEGGDHVPLTITPWSYATCRGR